MLTRPNCIFRQTIFRPVGVLAPQIFTRAKKWPRHASAPPGRPYVGLCPIFLGSLCFTRDVFFSFFLSPRDLRAPSADRREALPHDRTMGALYNASPKIRGPSPQRNRGPKTCKIWRDFRQLQISIANISGTGQDIQNRTEMCSPAIHPAFQEESPVNFGPLTTEKGMWVWTHPNCIFRETICRPLGGAGPSNITSNC